MQGTLPESPKNQILTENEELRRTEMDAVRYFSKDQDHIDGPEGLSGPALREEERAADRLNGAYGASNEFADTPGNMDVIHEEAKARDEGETKAALARAAARAARSTAEGASFGPREWIGHRDRGSLNPHEAALADAMIEANTVASAVLDSSGVDAALAVADGYDRVAEAHIAGADSDEAQLRRDNDIEAIQ